MRRGNSAPAERQRAQLGMGSRRLHENGREATARLEPGGAAAAGPLVSLAEPVTPTCDEWR